MIDRRNFMIGVAFGAPTLLVALTAGRGAEAKIEQAEKFVRDLVDTAVDILKLPEAATVERRAGIERLLDTRFDLPTITRLVLGRYWRRATPDQKQSFATVFRIHIIKVYNSQLVLYDDQIVNIKQVTPLNDTDTVIFTEIEQEDGPPLRIDWRVRDKGGRIKVVDVAAEGVSMVTTKRSEYRSVLAREGLDSLIARLEELNNQPE